jgi:hypothetical protein
MNDMRQKMTEERMMPLGSVALTELQTIGGGVGQAGAPAVSLDSVVPCRPAGILSRPLGPPPPVSGHFHSWTVS